MKGWMKLQQRLEEGVLSFGILAIALLMVANVFTRSLLGFSLTFAEEVSQFLIVLVCFVGLSYAVSQRRHIRMTAFVEQMSFEGRRLLEAAVAGSTALLLAFMAVFASRYAWIVADLGSVSPVLQVPLYLVYLTAPLGFVLSSLRYGVQARAWWRGVLDPGTPLHPDREPETSQDQRR